MISPEEAPTAAEVLRLTPAPDDAGAETADRYDWQAMMATADVLALYFATLDANGTLVQDADEIILIYEHHEDWAIVKGGEAEIISAKHREASVGPFSTYRQLLNDGGVLHIFQRWIALSRTPLCRLVTTGGLSNEAAKLAHACEMLRCDFDIQDPDVDEVIRHVAQRIASLTADEQAPDEMTVRAYLASLRIQEGEPRRDHVRDMAAQRYGLPVANRLGYADTAMAIWQAVLGLVRERMRAAGLSKGGALPVVLGVIHDDRLAPRALSLTDVDTAVRYAITHRVGYTPLPRCVIANKMGVKMAEGGCSDNAIARADTLRLQYRRYRTARRSVPDMSDHELRLNNTLHRVIDEATHEVRVEDGRWGPELWREMDKRFRALEGHADAQGLTADLLLGGASELANRCHAWYSDAFDAADSLQRVLAKESAS